jgi:hypothetical protein
MPQCLPNEISEKVESALSLLKSNPGMTRREACHHTHAAYKRVTRRIHGISPSNTCGGHNKKLQVPQTEALKDYITMCYDMGLSANIEAIVASTNSILRCDGSLDIVSHRWAKSWIQQNNEFIHTLKEKPLSVKHHVSYIQEDIEEHFRLFAQSKRK